MRTRCTNLEKRGQVTIYIIIGIIIVAAILLVILARDKIYVPATPENLRGQLQDVTNHIEDCMQKAAAEGVERIALQGGYLAVPEGSYRLWSDTTISYLCYNQQGKPTCTNRMLTREHMEKELADFMDKELQKCINVYQVGGGGFIDTFNVETAPKWKTEVTIQDSEVLLTLKYPVTIKAKSSGNKVSETEFKAVVNKPLGELYNVAMDIVNTEAQFGYFDVLTYVLSKTGRYTIYPHKPYPDKLYQIKLREDDFMFQLAIEGEPL